MRNVRGLKEFGYVLPFFEVSCLKNLFAPVFDLSPIYLLLLLSEHNANGRSWGKNLTCFCIRETDISSLGRAKSDMLTVIL